MAPPKKQHRSRGKQAKAPTSLEAKTPFDGAGWVGLCVSVGKCVGRKVDDREGSGQMTRRGKWGGRWAGGRANDSANGRYSARGRGRGEVCG